MTDGVKPVSPEEAEQLAGQSGHSRISRDIIDTFIAANCRVAEVDFKKYDSELFQMRMKLTSFAVRWEKPVRVFQKSGKLYLERLDWQDANSDSDVAGLTPLQHTLKNLGQE